MSKTKQGVSDKDRRSGKGCWYYTEIDECPICGRSTCWRERRWTPKPEDPGERYRYTQDMACSGHFL